MLRRLVGVVGLVLGLSLPAAAQLETSGNASSQGPGAGAATNFWNFRLTDGTTFYNASTDRTTAGGPFSVRISDGSSFVTVATDRTTAGGPFSIRLSDGAAFYDAAKTGQFPSALVGGRLDVNLGAWLGSTAPTVGQKTMANSVPVALASDNGLIVAQGSTTSGQSGFLAQGAVTTSPPTYTTGQTSPLSLDIHGGARTICTWPFPCGDAPPMTDADSIRFKVWNSAGCVNSLQTCDSLMIQAWLRYLRKDGTLALVHKVMTWDNDRAGSGVASGGASWPIGSTSGRGRSVSDATTPGTSVNISACTHSGTGGVAVGQTQITLSGAGTWVTNQIVTINISGAVCTPSVGGGTPWIATFTDSTHFTINATTTADTGAVGSVFSSIILQSATAAFVCPSGSGSTYNPGDVGKTFTLSAGGVVCTTGSSPCQGPFMPGNIKDSQGNAVLYMGSFVGCLSSTQMQVKPPLMGPFTNARLEIEPPLREDGTTTVLGDGWPIGLDVNFYQNGQENGRTFAEAESNINTWAPGATFDMHMGFSFFCDWMGTSEHLSWPGSRVCRHKLDGPAWLRQVTFGLTGGSAAGAALSISSTSVANPSVLTFSTNTGITVGQTQLIFISGTNTSPSINGFQYATSLSATTMSVPVNVASVTTGTGTVTGPFPLPAAGTDLSTFVPTNARWEIQWCRLSFTASSTVINRAIQLVVTDAGGTIVGMSKMAPQYIGASQTHVILWGPGQNERAEQNVNGAWQQYVDTGSIPTELKSGWKLFTSTTNIQSGDAITAGVCTVKEKIEEQSLQ